MNYLKLYIKICRRGMNQRPKKSDIIEKHHVFPISIYGVNTVLSYLTAREHLIVHMCLMRAFIKRYGLKHTNTIKMSMAVHKMIYRLSTKSKCRITARHYEIARQAAAASKKGIKRKDMVGKAYFGANEEVIRAGIEKMKEKKTGVKTNYPKKRKLRVQTVATNAKISATRKKTLDRYKQMSVVEFATWMAKQNLYMSDGRKNGNVTRALEARGEPTESYYD